MKSEEREIERVCVMCVALQINVMHTSPSQVGQRHAAATPLTVPDSCTTSTEASR
jgi:hypothetical protein